jgi:phospholipid-translocating ATPase
VAAGSAVGIVVYTGKETRSVMNNSIPRSKVGLIDLEINDLTKVYHYYLSHFFVIKLRIYFVFQILFAAVMGLAFLMMCLKGWEGPWFNYMFRFVLLFSYIIPISLRVNMDMAKSYYAYTIQKDPSISGTVVRSTTIPEDLGRISYLLTDKTGTLTQNEMIFKRLVLATSQADSADDVKEKLKQGLQPPAPCETHQRINEIVRITEAIKVMF